MTLVSCFLSLVSHAHASDLDQNIKHLEDPDENVRYEAVAALGDLADPEAIPALKKHLRDSSMLVRHASAEALVQIGGIEVESVFLNLLETQSIEQRRLAAVGLGLIGLGELAFERLKELSQDDNWEVRWASIYALGISGDPRGKDTLQEALNDSKAEVREVAESSVSRLDHHIRWYCSIEEGFKLADRDKKKLFVFFQIRSVNQCRKLQSQLMTQSGIVEMLRNFICVKINPKTDHDSVEKFSVKGVPTILLLDGERKILGRIDGLVRPEDFLKQITLWSEGKNESGSPSEKWYAASQLLDEEKFTEAVAILETLINEDSPYILLYLGYGYGKVGQHEKAVYVLEKLLQKYPDFDKLDKGLYCLSLSYLATGSIDKAKETLLNLEKKYKNHPTGKAATQILAKIEEREKS